MAIEGKKLILVRVCALFLLTLQTTSFFLLTRYSRGIKKERYIHSTCIVWSELIKFVASFFLVMKEVKASQKNGKEHYLKVFKNSLVLSPPALMYFFQNFLVYVSLQNFRAAYFSVLNQLKILTTAGFSVLILRRTLNIRKWLALVVLVVGVVLVKWQGQDEADTTESNIVGLTTAIIIPILSGCSGVYLELFVKKQHAEFSIWDRNLQLSFYSIFFALASAFIFDGNRIFDEGYFTGYSISAVLLSVLLGCGGLLVALVIKYANNIIKGFATSIAIVLSTIFSFLFWNFQINTYFTIGVGFVIVSIFLYMDIFGKSSAAPLQAPQQPQEQEQELESRDEDEEMEGDGEQGEKEELENELAKTKKEDD